MQIDTAPIWHKVIEHRVNYNERGDETVVRTVYRDYYFKEEADERADDLNFGLERQGYDSELWYTVEPM